MKKFVRSFLHKRGIIVLRNTQFNKPSGFRSGDYSYGINIPNANYAPWKSDKKFMDIYEQIKSNTLVDIYRCYELWQLTDEASKLSDELNILEIGVWRGGTAAVMASKMREIPGTLYLADTFSGVVKTGDKDSYYKGHEHNDTSREIVEKLMSDIGSSQYRILQGIFPDQTAEKIPSGTKFSLCHIDVDVYLSAKDCFEWVWERLVPGGIVVFDDYGFHTCDGITRFVEEQRQYKNRVVIHNLNGHGIIIKTA